jgi:hypothetical protein
MLMTVTTLDAIAGGAVLGCPAGDPTGAGSAAR